MIWKCDDELQVGRTSDKAVVTYFKVLAHRFTRKKDTHTHTPKMHSVCGRRPKIELDTSECEGN